MSGPGLPGGRVASQQHPCWALWCSGGKEGGLPASICSVLPAFSFSSFFSVDKVGFLCPGMVLGTFVSALLLGRFWFSLQGAFIRILSSLSQYFRNLPTCVLTGEENSYRLFRRHLEKNGRC